MCVVSAPSLVQAPKLLGISWVTGASFVLMKGLWVAPGHQKDRTVFRSVEFSAPPILQIRERGAGNGLNSGSPLREDAP